MTKLLKVDRVSTPEEAAQLATIGVDVISVAVDPDPRFNDDRTVPDSAVAAIGYAAASARLALEISFEEGSDAPVERVLALAPDFVQPRGRWMPSPSALSRFADAGIEMLWANIAVTHDDDDPDGLLWALTSEPGVTVEHLQDGTAS